MSEVTSGTIWMTVLSYLYFCPCMGQIQLNSIWKFPPQRDLNYIYIIFFKEKEAFTHVSTYHATLEQYVK